MFFAELDAAVVFARAGMQTGDLGTVEIRHAYTELIFAGELFGPARRFLGLAEPAGRSGSTDRASLLGFAGLVAGGRDELALHDGYARRWGG